MKLHFVMVDPANVIIASMEVDHPDMGPPYVLPTVEGGTWVQVDFQFSREGRRDTEVATLVDGAALWTDTGPLDDAIQHALDAIDGAAEAARAAVLAKNPTKSVEYAQAEEQAKEWRKTGYSGQAPEDVASWSAAKWRDGMTDLQAAEDILAQAEGYRKLLSGIRALRLRDMENVRHAETVAEVSTVVQQFTSDLSNLMKGSL